MGGLERVSDLSGAWVKLEIGTNQTEPQRPYPTSPQFYGFWGSLTNFSQVHLLHPTNTYAIPVSEKKVYVTTESSL